MSGSNPTVGGVTAGTPPSRASASAEFSRWTARAASIWMLLALLPMFSLVSSQADGFALWWVVVVAGGIVASAVAVGVMGWVRGTIRLPAIALAAFSLFGTATWPLVWDGEPQPELLFLWWPLGSSITMLGIGAGIRMGYLFALIAATTFAGTRLALGAPLADAVSDLLFLLFEPPAILVAVQYVATRAREFDQAADEFEQAEAEATTAAAVDKERQQLGAVIHDLVLSTLVRAARSEWSPDPMVADSARQAMERLDRGVSGENGGRPVSGEHLVGLLRSVVLGACPRVSVTVHLPKQPVKVPIGVARALAQAAREAVVNADKHALASTIEAVLDLRALPSQVRVDVRDDGRGFDPKAVDPERLGLRVSIQERMRLVGGEAVVDSRPGHGTNVQFTWAEPEEDTTAAADRAETSRHPWTTALWGEVVVLFAWAAVVLQCVLGILSSSKITSVETLLVAEGLALVATGIALYRAGRMALPRWVAVVVVALALVFSGLTQAVVMTDVWPRWANWYEVTTRVLLMVLVFRGRPGIAWMGVGLFSVQAWVWSAGTRFGVDGFTQLVSGPVFWLALTTFMYRWLKRLDVELSRSVAASQEAARVLADTVSKQVLRDVWLTELRSMAWPTLRQLSDPERRLSQAERDECLALEAKLRDMLRAGTLMSPRIVDAIVRARARGVEVILVDNRGEGLPDPVRRPLLEHVEDVLNVTTHDRVVVRLAPAGYQDVATILAIGDEECSLTTFDADGLATVSQE